jgi:hypothetical protein
MCITGSFFKQIKKKLKNFFARGEQHKKEIPEMCTIGGPFESSETCSHESGFAILRLCFFFQGDILQIFFRLRQAKIIGEDRETLLSHPRKKNSPTRKHV